MKGRVALVLVGMTGGCSLVTDLSGYTGGAAAQPDAATPTAADASTPDGASTDASDAGGFCNRPDRRVCEDFEQGFDPGTLTFQGSTTAVLSTAHYTSASHSLLVTAGKASGIAAKTVPFGKVTASTTLRFAVRFEALTGRVHLFNLAVTTSGGQHFLYADVYPDRVAVGEGVPSDGGASVGDRTIAMRTVTTGKWYQATLTIAGLDGTPTSSFVFDDTTVEAQKPLSGWGPGDGNLVLVMPYADAPTTFYVDDVEVDAL